MLPQMKLRLLDLNRSAVVNFVASVTADRTAFIEFCSAVVNIVVSVTADGTAFIEFCSAVVMLLCLLPFTGLRLSKLNQFEFCYRDTNAGGIKIQ